MVDIVLIEIDLLCMWELYTHRFYSISAVVTVAQRMTLFKLVEHCCDLFPEKHIFAGLAAASGIAYYILLRQKTGAIKGQTNCESSKGTSRKCESDVYVNCNGTRKQIGFTLETKEENPYNWKHSIKIQCPDLMNSFAKEGIQNRTELQRICDASTRTMDHEDALEYFLKQDPAQFVVELYFCRQNEQDESEDHTRVVTFNFDNEEMTVSVEQPLKPKPIKVVPREGKYFTDEKYFIRWVKGGDMYIIIRGTGDTARLDVGPIGKGEVQHAWFTRRQYSGRTYDIPPSKCIVPNNSSVIVHLFHKEMVHIVNYVANKPQTRSVALTNRGNPIEDTLLDENDFRFFLFERIPGTNHCVFISTCCKLYLCYNAENKSLCLKDVPNPNMLVNNPGEHDDVKFEIIPATERVPCRRETTV